MIKSDSCLTGTVTQRGEGRQVAQVSLGASIRNYYVQNLSANSMPFRTVRSEL